MTILENEPLSKHTNFRIGGPARWFVVVKDESELREAIAFAAEHGVPFRVIGGGSNVLASDEGFSGVVIQMAMRGVTINGTTVTADAGAMSAAVARQTASVGLKGMEWAISLPGTIGGAVRGNAGCFGGEMKDVVRSVSVLRGKDVVEVVAADLRFAYRESAMKQSNDIILFVTMDLTTGDRGDLLRKIDEMLETRKTSQPLYAGSAGCMFKNYDAIEEDLQRFGRVFDLLPQEMPGSAGSAIGGKSSRRVSAGWLIDKLGLKGMKIGNAQISPEHGNFIINLGGATASDVAQLIALVKTRARDQVGIQLQEEVQYLGL
ncbi:UDP-N-acetylenolpyruvoylglucosamine reductase [Candidatus Uhrbacteria bacterium RIFOXYB12_FULL_58_10]|uniref:UDP-N-acetylenolpyruvoylglucosamine reductase n=1 Tax=Candidatus Uhrbacteria bacterium RIFOXYB2_FULL_57_15 TaxID=1802422 RepID=A0A1F7W739_9BACT|nr:MAG: UDP-N-acetylenolpyruvoylglucosamine reductase [Candidatus Uhrbacteria bacterium RIFOXYB12_FULL_58_10]OGL98466.1 MAG: UDP-N-acetylenolpyruvoylglucosamine reductase [Candidatus Uhrbacteria bacterium RIFOXYB2_FULL_57_15]OGL99219.1 MAG: UDP-N-acetylenolpyruvoylglucosamine reductase [Candidatus Uhrbacteria bacterium RIFOXYC12_FULL_57_11]